MVPGYLSMVSGLSAAELTGGGGTPALSRWPMVQGVGLFVGGFTVVFVSLGAAASSVGRLLDSHLIALSHLSGAVVVLFGLILLLGTLPAQVWSHLGSGSLGAAARLTGERRFDVRPSNLGNWAAPVMGMAFAFAWTPCVGPVLGVVLGLAAKNGTLPGGVLLLLAYSLGLAVPFVATGLAFGHLTAAFARARRGLRFIELVAGLVLVAFGVLLLTDHVSWVATQISKWLDDIGLGRLSTS